MPINVKFEIVRKENQNLASGEENPFPELDLPCSHSLCKIQKGYCMVRCTVYQINSLNLFPKDVLIYGRNFSKKNIELHNDIQVL